MDLDVGNTTHYPTMTVPSSSNVIELDGMKTMRLDDLLPGDVIRITEIGTDKLAHVMSIENVGGARRILHVRGTTVRKRERDVKVWLWSYSRIEVIATVERPDEPEPQRSDDLNE